MSLRYEAGDLLSAPVDAIVNTVNTRGVMGKGIALQVKQRWPEVDRAYRVACKAGAVNLGRMHLVELGGLSDGPRVVINFPTKNHWRSKSRLSDIELGLVDLRAVVERLRLQSIAVPPLGCGNGGLDWADVRPLIEAALGDLVDVDVVVFTPDGAPDAVAMRVGTERPSMSRTLAGLIRLLGGYWSDPLGITDIEVQKLAYFLGVRRPELRLRFHRGPYGPYCEPLHHVLQRAEGHYLRGYGDRTRRPWEPGVLIVLEEGRDDAAAVVARTPRLEADLTDVEALIDGFEGAWGMELLSTVHWVASQPDGASEPNDARCRIAAWSMRKNRLFSIEDVTAAWNRLDAGGWLAPSTDAPQIFEA